MQLDTLHSVAQSYEKGKSIMRKLVIGMALASAAFATPAMARDDSWYIEGDFGGLIVEDMTKLANSTSGLLDHNTGYDLGGIVGYDFGMFRLEAEASYRRASNDKFTTATTSFSGANIGGSSSALSFMLNGLLDFGPDDGLQGFVGGGVGVGRAKVRMPLATSAALSINDSDSDFA